MEWFDELREAREKAGLSQAKLGRQLGISQAAVAKIEAGQVTRSQHARPIARALGVPVENMPTDILSDVALEIVRPVEMVTRSSPENEIPVYAAVEGGPGEMIREKEPIGWIARPDPLKGMSGGYAVYIVGTSMIPEYRPGEQAIAHPKLPPAPDTTCIFYTNDAFDDRATIKHLIRATNRAWIVQQWNPAREFELDRGEWPVCHRVVGKNNRR